MFYLSGPDAEVTAAALRAGGVQAEGLGGRAGQASALKMGYAGFTKGTTALLLELTLVAHAWGFRDAILAKDASSHPAAPNAPPTRRRPWAASRPYATTAPGP
jgi:hypothetical protein